MIIVECDLGLEFKGMIKCMIKRVVDVYSRSDKNIVVEVIVNFVRLVLLDEEVIIVLEFCGLKEVEIKEFFYECVLVVYE